MKLSSSHRSAYSGGPRTEDKGRTHFSARFPQELSFLHIFCTRPQQFAVASGRHLRQSVPSQSARRFPKRCRPKSSALPMALSRVSHRGISGSCPMGRSPGIAASSESSSKAGWKRWAFQNRGESLGGVGRSAPLGRVAQWLPFPGGRRQSEASATTMRPGWLARAAFVLLLGAFPLFSDLSASHGPPVPIISPVVRGHATGRRRRRGGIARTGARTGPLHLPS